jgi:hypothetical protein
MLRNVLLGMVVVALLATTSLFAPIATPVQAASMAALRGFHASCGHFSVDVTVTGVTNDQDGWDRFRFQVVDGAGQVLFREDSARWVGRSDRAWVVHMPYAKGVEPAANPIRFQVIDLDVLARPVGVVTEQRAESACFAGGKPTSRLEALLPEGVTGRMLTESALYTDPNGAALALTVERGREFTALYVSPDRLWTAIYVGGDNLVWVRSRDIDLGAAAGRLVSPPVTLDPSQQVSGVVIPLPPVSTARVNYTLRLRQGPSTQFATITRIPSRTVIAVYGRTADSRWILVSYNGLGGWVASRFVSLIDLPLRQLPIVG